MKKSIVVRGRLSGSRHIDLEEPVTGIEGEVEVVLRPVPVKPEKPKEGILDFIARMPGGTRSKEDIDRQIREERDSWGRP